MRHRREETEAAREACSAAARNETLIVQLAFTA